MLCRQPPVRITAPTIVLAIGLGVRPADIFAVVLCRPHQTGVRIRNGPIAIGNEALVTDLISGISSLSTNRDAVNIIVIMAAVPLNILLVISLYCP